MPHLRGQITIFPNHTSLQLDEQSALPLGRSVAVHFQGTGMTVLGGMLIAGLGVESYMLGNLQEELDTRLAKIRERLETSRAELALNIDSVVEESVDNREMSRRQIFATKM